MKNSIFTSAQFTEPKSNTFDLSHDRKMTTQMGRLTPSFLMDVIPGDRVKLKASSFLRFAPLISPVMHNIKVYQHYFFVPNRLLWDNWENFITGGEDGQDNSVLPYRVYNLNTPSNVPSLLIDYLGLPCTADFDDSLDRTRNISVLPFAAYQLIWDSYYRDQNLQTDPADRFAKLNDGAISSPNWLRNIELRYRAWQHDYFTSALPWTQKGPEAMLPLGTSAPVVWDDNWQGIAQSLYDTGGVGNKTYTSGAVEGAASPAQYNLSIGSGGFAAIDLENSHIADLSSATASSIIDLRRAFKLQEWLEKNARGGSRYVESIQVHFGVKPEDSRLQRPEYLGGSSSNVKISEVLQMAQQYATDGEPLGSPTGSMAGHGLQFDSGKSIGYTAKEHGYIMGIMSVMPMSAYQQGIPRHFQKFDRFDYYWPSFAHIGEQAIMQDEIWPDPETDGSDIFGYAPRYSEYKFMNSSVHGDFKETLDFWHLGRRFGSKPALNEDFIVLDPAEVERIFAVNDEGESDKLWCHIYNDVKATRKMPFFGNPKM